MSGRRRRDYDHDEDRIFRVGREGAGEEGAEESTGDDFDPALFETHIEATAVVDQLIASAADDDRRLPALLVLRHQLEVDKQQREEALHVIREFEEAYEKLTSPANRVATFLGATDEGVATIVIGDSEYYANIDPKMDAEQLRVGHRVRVNDAYVIVGGLGYASDGPIVKVAEALPDGRIRVGSEPASIGSRIVLRGAELLDVTLKSGDEILLDPTGHVAIEPFAKTETSDLYFEKVPEIPWSKIGGQEDAIQLIRDTIELPLLHPELFARFGKRPLKGILLYGPPGCGKTLIGKATAYNLTREYSERMGRQVQDYFMYISGPRILNMWLGESERMVREIFSTARERAKEGYLVFIFIDEAESLLRTRSSGRGLNIANTLVPQFSAEMDGLVALENVVVMLTSNRPDYIDPAILRPERVDRKVKIGRPDRRASKDILDIYLDAAVPLDPDLVSEHGDTEAARGWLVEQSLDRLFARSRETEFLNVHLVSGKVDTLHWRDLLSGAVLMSIIERAKDLAIKRSIAKSSESEGVSLPDLEQAVKLEFKENEIFPKSSHLEDWLKLIDYEPENVAAIKPIRPERGHRAARGHSVI